MTSPPRRGNAETESNEHVSAAPRSREKDMSSTRFDRASDAHYLPTVSILDAMERSFALLDERGQILLVNDRWRRVGRPGARPRDEGWIGCNYVELLDA